MVPQDHDGSPPGLGRLGTSSPALHVGEYLEKLA